MTKYHINKKGIPSPCKATKSCPLGGEDAHYPSQEAAQEAVDKLNAESYGILQGLNGETSEYDKYKGSHDFGDNAKFKHEYFEGSYATPNKTYEAIVNAPHISDNDFSEGNMVNAFDHSFKEGGTALKYESESFNNTPTELVATITKVDENSYKISGTLREYSATEEDFDSEEEFEEYLAEEPDMSFDVDHTFSKDELKGYMKGLSNRVKDKKDVPGAINYGLYDLARENMK